MSWKFGSDLRELFEDHLLLVRSFFAVSHYIPSSFADKDVQCNPAGLVKLLQSVVRRRTSASSRKRKKHPFLHRSLVRILLFDVTIA